MHAFLRRLPLLALILVALAMPALAQQGGEDDYDFSDIPVEEEEIPYIGVGGGYQLAISLFDLDPLNTVSSSLGMPAFSGPLFMHGGGGWTAIGVIPNVRLGVFGGGGSKEVTADTSIGGVDYKRALRFGSGYTAALIDYAITPFSKFTIAPGVLVGAGSTTLDFAQTRSANATFASAFDSTALGNGGEANRQTAIERSYFLLAGQVNLEYALTQFILVRAGASYSHSFGDASVWTNRHDVDVSGVPEITTDGLGFQVGLFIGLFQQ
jgi:hypothetical protein